MTKKRANSEGNIIKRGDGRWMARVTTPDGKRKAYYGRTQTEVLDKLQAVQKRITSGLPLSGDRVKTADFLEGWLSDTAANKVRPKTLVRYEELVRLHIAPEIGRIPLVKLTPQHVERMLLAVAAKGVSPRTASHCRAVLRNALNHAMKHSLLGRNVAALADGPTVPEPEVRVLSPKAAARVLAAVRDDRLEALFTVALACGLRQSEALGLRWGDVDLDGNVLTVQRTIQRVNQAYRVFDPKTKRSRRTIV